ncbi:DOPA-like domain-containing protein [Ochromonadaceae sp. CCMP2298]|nr:DOPA-like domain-containing protein [Ochromonadaceae sp. CCMP2298]|mmetsp:Transcript_21636/g.46910  ORF Transcript_21636/g.46910 Transcript_21636/m.46910 type:complete len:173 (+) Transcript_21636:10-528(+)
MSVIVVLLLCWAALVSAHEHPGLLQRLQLSSKDEIDCTPEGVQFQSYHVHVLFWQNNRNSTAAALKLQGQFMEAFGLGLADKCQFSPSATMPDADMCYFQTDFEPAGPFVTAQYSFFVPTAQYEIAVGWMLRRRGTLDVLVHPNSGCGLQDHLQYSSWGGRVWEIDPAPFLD